MTPITIRTAAIQYGTGQTECHCEVVADSIVGPQVSLVVVPLDSTSLSDDWTDEELCAAVAKALGVDEKDVSVYTTKEEA